MTLLRLSFAKINDRKHSKVSQIIITSKQRYLLYSIWPCFYLATVILVRGRLFITREVASDHFVLGVADSFFPDEISSVCICLLTSRCKICWYVTVTLCLALCWNSLDWLMIKFCWYFCNYSITVVNTSGKPFTIISCQKSTQLYKLLFDVIFSILSSFGLS